VKKLLKMFIATLLISCLILSFNLPAGAHDLYIKITNGFNLDGSTNGQRLPLGATIHHFNNGKTEVRDSNNYLILTTNDSEAGLVTTPEGAMKANHVYHVPDGTYINHVGDNLKCYINNRLILTIIDTPTNRVIPNNPRPHVTNNPIHDNVESAIQIISPDTFNANWICPSNPPQPSPYITNYLWNGIEAELSSNHSFVGLIQPVLMWHQNGTNTWTGAAWYVYHDGNIDGSVESPDCPVSSGDSCSGNMHYNSYNNWEITFYNNTSHLLRGLIVSTSIIPTPGPDMTNYELITLETFDFSGSQNPYVTNGMLPGTTTFNGIVLTKYGQNINSNWIADYPYLRQHDFSNLTNLSVTWSGNTLVTLHTGNP